MNMIYLNTTKIFSSLLISAFLATNSVTAASVDDTTLIEGDSGSSVQNIATSLSSAAPAGGRAIMYSATNISATEDSDFSFINDRLVIEENSSSSNIPVTVFGDLQVEGNETFTLNVFEDLISDPGFDNANLFWTPLTGSPACEDGPYTFETRPETVYGGTDANNRVLEVDCESQGEQTIPTLIGETYNVSIKVALRVDNGPQSADVTLSALNGTTVLNSITVTKDVVNNPTFNLVEETFSFVATSTQTNIRFTTTNDSTLGLLFDDLSITTTNPSDSATITISESETAPNPPSVNAPTNGTPISGTGVPGLEVIVTTPSGATCTATVQSDGSWSCPLSPEPIDGEDVSAIQFDANENPSNTTTEIAGIEYTPNLTAFFTNCVAGVKPEESLLYSLTIDNSGNLDITNASINTVFGAGITNPDWICQATGGAVCHANSGTGDLSNNIELPIGSNITYFFESEVDGQLLDFIDVEASVSMPAGITDFDLNDNIVFDSDLIFQFIFKDGFECALPGTLNQTTEQLESFLSDK